MSETADALNRPESLRTSGCLPYPGGSSTYAFQRQAILSKLVRVLEHYARRS
jgi:hypothetical protein